MNEHKDYICVTSGMRGYFTVLMKWYQQEGTVGMYDVCCSGETAKTFDDCVTDAKDWAQAEGIEYRGAN